MDDKPEVTTQQHGTKLTFADVFQDWQQPIYHYLLRMTENPAEAEDLTQETFIRVNDALAGFRGDSSLSTWLYRIARNVFLDNTRRSSTRQAENSVPLENITPVSDAAPVPEQALSQSEMSSCVQDAIITSLPVNYRTVLVLSDFQGLRNREIAEILDCSLDTVKIRLHRARAKLREALNKGCDMSHDERNVLVCEPKHEAD